MKNRNIESDTLHSSAAGQANKAFTVLELLVVVAIIGLLIGLLLPAVQVARDAARRMQCSSHLRQIGIGLQSHHDSLRTLPAGWKRDHTHATAFGWGASLLPYMEKTTLYTSIDFSVSLLSRSNEQARSVTPSLFLCPADYAAPTFSLYEEEHQTPSSTNALAELPVANYVGVFGTSDPDDVAGETGEGTFLLDTGTRFVELRRGLSHVVLVSERTAKKLPSTWLGIVIEGEDAAGRVVGNAFDGPNRDDVDECEFDSRHAGCVNFLWADGHVDCVSDDIDTQAYRAMATRSDKLPQR